MMSEGTAARMILACVLSACGRTPVAPVTTLYGADDRRQPYEVTETVRSLVHSTAAIVRRAKLKSGANGGWELLAEGFGALFRLCQQERFFEEPAGASCSAFLVAPNMVASAGHCVEDERDCARSSLVFDYAYQNSWHPQFFRFQAGQVFSCVRVLHSGTNGLDFSLLEIDGPVQGRPPLPLAEEPDAGAEVFAIGHPSGLPAKVIGGRIRSSQWNPDVFLADLDTASGSSGSAVFDARLERVVGILVGGDVDFEDSPEGCKRTKLCDDGSCRGERVLRAAAFAAFLRGGDRD